MLRLLLLRHAKAAWPSGVPDPQRPLAPRGRAAAPVMGAYIRNEHLLPDLAIVSPAQRTRETWDLVRAELGEDVPAQFEPRIYEAQVENLLYVLQNEHAARTILMVGHNPGFEELAQLLISHGDRYAFARLSQKFPTGGLAVIDFDAASWPEVTQRSGRLDRFVTPRSLGGAGDDGEA